ncbi:signal peptide-containing protein [Cryptosporidium canis]|uniref:Signal peptide-containing protein n=1 Tax=Cryptosporidium canis TaxID=195482 RepID=A0A9D5DJE6_9CRYT|nr:signal peptide-containing protein [Cryptosporidium canis]
MIVKDEIINKIKVRWIIRNCFFLLIVIILSQVEISDARPFFNFKQQITIETVYKQIYDTSCRISEEYLTNFGYFGGYLASSIPSKLKRICIEIDENSEVESQMKELNMEISLEDPLKSAQYIWTISRLKLNLFIIESECYFIWISVLEDLKLINVSDIPEFLPEYRKIISSRPIIPGKQISLRIYPNMDDLLVIFSVTTQIYKVGKFATDFTEGKLFFLSSETKKNTTPLVRSNIQYYLPILTRLYPPSIDYKHLFSSVSFVYRMIHYCTGRIIFPNEAWEIWSLINSFAGGGYIPNYHDLYADTILNQDYEDTFPEERNFIVVLERLIEIQYPSWNVSFPPMNDDKNSGFGGLEDHELFKFMKLKGLSMPNKNSKDLDGVIAIYFIFHYVLHLFISIATARDLWIVIKSWLTYSTDYLISNNVSFVQNERHITNRELKYLKSTPQENIPKWATGSQNIGIYSEIVNTFVSEFENEFPYIVSCPDGELVLKDTNRNQYKYLSQKVQKIDRIAVNIAKEIHTIFPGIKFRKICELASAFSLIIPFDFKLFSKFTTRKKNKTKKSKPGKDFWKFEDNLKGIEYCRKGILNVLRDGGINLKYYDKYNSIHLIEYLDSACLRIIKSQIKCSINTPYYFPYQVSSTINTFAGNIANALTSSLVGGANYYYEVIGTIWDGRLQSSIQEDAMPSLFRVHNPEFNPENLCDISEHFVNPAIIGYFEKKLIYQEKNNKSDKMKNLINRIKERYYSKHKICNNNIESFYSDLLVLKEIVNAHKIPKGANLNDWKEFVLDEESISSFILNQLKKPKDFNSVCKTLMERKFRSGDIQFFPISTDSNQYREYLLNRMKRSNVFLKKLVKDEKSDINLKEISRLLIFKDESLLEFPETIASNIRDSIYYDRFDLQFKNLIQWYINESCEKASALVYKDVKTHGKNFWCVCPKCFDFSDKSDDVVYSTDEYSKCDLKLVGEALEFGIKVVMNNPNINLYISSIFNNKLNILSKSGIVINLHLSDKNFIINNANFIYVYLSRISIPITKNMALLASEIASKLLKIHFLQGEVLVNNKIAFLLSDNMEIENVGNPQFFSVTLDSNLMKNFRNYCNSMEHNERAIMLLETIVSNGSFKNNSNKTFLHWNNSYMSPQMACEIVEELTKSGIIIEDQTEQDRIKQSKACLDFISFKYPGMPQVPIPVCMSQKLMVECETGNNLDNVFASIIMSNYLEYGIKDNLSSVKNYACSSSKYFSNIYSTHDFIDRCKDLFVNVCNFENFVKEKLINSNSWEPNLLMDTICNNINLMHSCRSFNSNQKVTDEIKRVADLIVIEIINEFSDFDFYWGKDIMCEAANNIIKYEIEDCMITVENILIKIDGEFPKEFHKIICSKINIWPRSCPQEKFSNHSVLSNLFYRYVTIPIFRDDLLKNQKRVNDMNFYDVCNILESNHSIENYKSSDLETSTIGMDSEKLCESYFEQLFPSSELYEEMVGIRIIDKRKECKQIISNSFISVIKDRANFSFFDSDSGLIPDNIPYLPDYMHQKEIADKLINEYRLPPRITLMTIGLFHALNELNLNDQVKYEFSILGLIYNSVKMVMKIDKLNEDDFLLECINVNKERIFPRIGNTELKRLCKSVTLSFENQELVENIYLLYSLNIKVSSYYSTHFTSENISFISKSYLSKVLRGKPSLKIQKVYEDVLNEYIDYMFIGFDSFIQDSSGKYFGISMYKRLGVKEANKSKFNIKSKQKEEQIQNDVELFLNENLYKTDVKEKHKDKLVRALVMFNFLLETKRMGVFQIHSPSDSFEISQEISSKTVLRFMPPDFANWLMSYENYKFINKLFVVPIYSDGKKVIGPIADLDIENNLLYDELSSKGIALNRIMNIIENKQKFTSSDRKLEISSTILESTIKYIIYQYRDEKPIEYSSSIVNNSYLFRNVVKRLRLNNEIIFDIRPRMSPNSLYIHTEYILFEVLRYFIENSPSELRSKTDIILNKFDFSKNLHKDSLHYYKGDINSEEMRHVRKRYLCKSFNQQIMRDVDYGSNPFFECYYFRTENGNLRRENRHIEGKTTRNCEFSPRLTQAKTMDEKYLLLKKYIRFLSNNQEYYTFLADSLRLLPETIIHGIGRIYGYCLLIGEPLNFYFSNFIIKYIKTGNPNNESNINNYLDGRIGKFQDMISLAFNTLNSRKFTTSIMNFESAKKKVFKGEPIYYYIDHREFGATNLDPNIKLKGSGLFEINNFNNLRFLRKNISKFIGYEKFKLEIESFVSGIYDIIPRRFLRSFFNSNLFYFSQGYISTSIKNEVLFKSLLSSYFYVESDELLLPHKRILIQWFHIALNSFTYTDIGYFFAVFTDKFSIFPPTAYVGKIRIVDLPLDEEKNPENRIIIDPLLLVVYIPNYKTYIELEKSISRIIEMNKRKLTFSA